MVLAQQVSGARSFPPVERQKYRQSKQEPGPAKRHTGELGKREVLALEVKQPGQGGLEARCAVERLQRELVVHVNPLGSAFPGSSSCRANKGNTDTAPSKRGVNGGIKEKGVAPTVPRDVHKAN